jgi:hypothetical protein
MTQKHHPRARELSVRVDVETIDDAIPRDSSHCMIAEAVRSAFPAAKAISVDLQTIRFSDPDRGLRYTYLTPRVAQLALINFDMGVKPEPFSFRLRGGGVTASGRRPPLQKQSEEHVEKATAARKATAEKVRKMSATIVGRGRAGTAAEVVGGRTPPVTTFARRRSFGLRALER